MFTSISMCLCNTRGAVHCRYARCSGRRASPHYYCVNTPTLMQSPRHDIEHSLTYVIIVNLKQNRFFITFKNAKSSYYKKFTGHSRSLDTNQTTLLLQYNSQFRNKSKLKYTALTIILDALTTSCPSSSLERKTRSTEGRRIIIILNQADNQTVV